MRTLTRACTVAGLATVLTAFVGATAAQAASVMLPDDGTLLGDGAGVSVSVTFDCDAGWNANVMVEAAQTVRHDQVATGFGYTETVDCEDGEESVDVVVLAGGNSYAFRDGEAVVRVSVSTCDTQTCEQAVAAGEVTFGED